MNIEEQRQAMREAQAERRYDQWRASSVDLAVGIGYNYCDLPESAKDEWRAKAVDDLAFLTEKGAVLKFDPRARREGQMDEVPRLTMTAPLIEK